MYTYTHLYIHIKVKLKRIILWKNKKKGWKIKKEDEKFFEKYIHQFQEN